MRLSFAGSDELAAQIRRGAKPDVYAAANTKLPDELADEGLLSEPEVFASNELVIAVPADSQIKDVTGLQASGTKLVIGSEDVPVGSYTREVLGRLPGAERKAILANVRSEEPDVKGALGKLAQGAADAGFVYLSDVKATDGKLVAITLGDDLKPDVAYGAGVVEGAKQPDAGETFVRGLVDGDCSKALLDAGFGPPPSS